MAVRNNGYLQLLGIILASFFISIQGQYVPRPPTDLQISDITTSSLRLSWSPNPGSEDVLHYIIKYRPKTSANQGFSEISGVMSNTYTMTNLSPYTEYEFYVIAVNSAGRGAPSSPIVAPFLRADPGSPPSNIQARLLSTTSVVIQWDPPKEFIGQVLAYKVYYSIRLDLPISQWNMQQVGNNHLTTLTGLIPRTVYAITIQAFTIHGFGPHSTPIQVKTQRRVPTQPQRLVVTDISETSVTLYWSRPSPDVDTVVGYELYWNDSYTNEQFHKRLEDTDAHNVTGLHSDSLYSVWVAAKSRHGEGAPTPPIQVRTKEYVPNKVKRITTKTINTTTITINWKYPLPKDDGKKFKDRKGLIEGYHIYISENSDTVTSPNEPQEFYVEGDSAEEYTITDLQPSTQYSIQIAAVTRKGDGPRSKVKTARTDGGVPTRPELRVRLIPGDPHFVVEVSWFPPVYINGNLRSYRLIYGRKDLFEKEEMKIQELDPRTERQTIHYLEHGALYAFYLTAKNDYGWGQEATALLETPESAPLAAPQNLSFSLQSPSTVIVWWLPPPLQYRNGEIIHYGILSHKVLDEKTIERKTFDTRIVFSGLPESTDFIFRVRAYTAKGAGPWSNRVGVSTPRYVLPAPSDISVYATSEESVEVSWKWDPTPYLVDALGFQVMYARNPAEDLDEWSSKRVPYTFSAELTGLESYATYAIMIAVVTADGLGRLSEIESIEVNPTDVPLRVGAKDITLNTFTLYWERPSKLDPFKYQISYDAYKEFYDGDGMLQEFDVPVHNAYIGPLVTEYTVYNLMPFTSYRVNISVIALDERYRPPAKVTVTTAMAAPMPIAKPGIFGLGGEVSIILPKISEENGPISDNLFVVVPENYALRDPVEYLTAELGALPSDKIGPYITARFPYGMVPERFPLGDGKVYGNYLNRRLEHHERYRVFIRAIVDTPLKNLYTSSPLSDVISWDLTSPPEQVVNIDYGYLSPPIPEYDIPTENNKSRATKRGDLFWIICPVVLIIWLIS